MAFWAITGKEGVYEGLHGMYESVVFEGTEEEAMELGQELSDNVMQSYECIREELDLQAEQTCHDEDIDVESDEAAQIFDDCYKDNRLFYIYKLNAEKLPTFDTHDLSNLYYNDPENFLEKYQTKDNK